MGSTSKMRVPPSSKKSKVYRVVLTGGPCGGKSSALKDFTKKLNEHGYDVYTAPEVPTIMINGGCQYPGMEGKEELDEFETALLKLQLQMESSFTQCAASTGRPSVVVRGVAREFFFSEFNYSTYSLVSLTIVTFTRYPPLAIIPLECFEHTGTRSRTHGSRCISSH